MTDPKDPILPLRQLLDSPAGDLDALAADGSLHAYVADRMDDAVARGGYGTPGDWVLSARLHVEQQIEGRTEGGSNVSVSALHLLLGYIAHLETRRAAA